MAQVPDFWATIPQKTEVSNRTTAHRFGQTLRLLTRICLCVSVVFPPASVPAAADDFPAVLDRASAYVAEFESQFRAILWHETYEQTDRLPLQFGASGSRFTRVGRRTLSSEMLFIWVEDNATWLTVRDVMSVDGRPVPRRLPALLSSKNVRLQDLRALSEENGRHNIGQIARNFNEPTLALLLLDSRYRPRFAFADGGVSDLGGRLLRRIQFVETATPTVIRTLNRDAQSSGTIFVEPETGHVLRTELTVIQDRNNTRGDIAVSYGPDDKLGMFVPIEMHESYGFARTKPAEGISCTAKYSDFRRFETSGRMIIP